MAGHSKWANIQHRKGKQDKLRSKMFSKLAKEITVAAKMGDPDPDKNPRLRLAVKASKAVSMPKDVIDRVHAAVVKITAQQSIRDRFGALGATTLGNTPAEFGEYIRQDYAKMQKVVAAANIRAD